MLPLPIPAVWAISLTDIWDIFLFLKGFLALQVSSRIFSEFGLVECGIVAPLLLVTFILIYIITIHVILP